MFGDVNRSAAVFTSKCQTLDQPKRDQDDRRDDFPGS